MLTEIFANNILHAGAWCFSAVEINRFICKEGERSFFALKVSSSSLPAETGIVGFKCLSV